MQLGLKFYLITTADKAAVIECGMPGQTNDNKENTAP